jgi:hypothetical protein
MEGFQDSYYDTVTNTDVCKKDMDKLDYLFYTGLNGLLPASMRTNSIRCIDEAESVSGALRKSFGHPHVFDTLIPFRNVLVELNSICSGNSLTQTAYSRVNILIENSARVGWRSAFARRCRRKLPELRGNGKL